MPSLPQRMDPAQLGGFVAVERDVNRAATAVADRLPAFGLAPLRPCRPAASRVKAGGKQPLAAPARLADRRDHPRRDLRCTLGVAGVDHEDVAAIGGRFERAGETDQPASDDDEIHRSRSVLVLTGHAC